MRSGMRVSYVLYAFMLLTLALFALLASVNELSAVGVSHASSSHIDTLHVDTVEDVSMHFLRGQQGVGGNGTHVGVGGNGTHVGVLEAAQAPHTHSSAGAGSNSGSALSFWFSMLMSLFTWMSLVVVLRCLRNAAYSHGGSGAGGGFAGSGGNPAGESARMLAQMMGMRPGGLSNRMGGMGGMGMRLALLNRDFNGDDYEMLRELDQHVVPLHQGADEQQIQRLPLHTVTAQEVRNEQGAESGANRCSICLGPYEEGESVRTVRCLHKFHAECIDPWLRTNPTCPICKFHAVE
jgi:hypothetical protein